MSPLKINKFSILIAKTNLNRTNWIDNCAQQLNLVEAPSQFNKFSIVIDKTNLNQTNWIEKSLQQLNLTDVKSLLKCIRNSQYNC